jgi:hypothetical protein
MRPGDRDGASALRKANARVLPSTGDGCTLLDRLLPFRRPLRAGLTVLSRDKHFLTGPCGASRIQFSSI